MKPMKLILATVASAALALGAAAQAGEHKGEVVDMKALPAPVQKAITEKAAGGKVIRVEKEDDKDGKWNYEVTMTTDGKKSVIEFNPEGKFLKKHDDHSH